MVVFCRQVSFQTGQNEHNLQRGPTSYQLVGSNDAACSESSTWAVLCEDLTNQPWKSYEDVKYCKVKPEVTGKYRCLGIRVLRTRKMDIGDGWVTVRNIRIWERIEMKCVWEPK